MRLTEAKIQSLSEQLLQTLLRQSQVKFRGTESQVALRIRTVITEDLRREDGLDEEVRELLEAALRGKNRMSVDYQALFKKAKAQLIRDRKLVI
jgi:hypothetical protein